MGISQFILSSSVATMFSKIQNKSAYKPQILVEKSTRLKRDSIWLKVTRFAVKLSVIFPEEPVKNLYATVELILQNY